jgi:tetratricopeptide (TPR) repeat protein
MSEAQTSVQNALPALSGATLDDAKCFLAMVIAFRAATVTQDLAAQAAHIVGTNENYVPAIVVLATQQEQQGKYDQAKKSYENALARYPAFSPAARNLAILCARQPGDEQRAYELGMKARSAFPDDANLTCSLGVLAYRRGDYSQSAQLLKDGAAKLNNGEMLYYLGKATYQLKQKQESKDALQRALSLNLQSDLAADAQKLLAELKQK